MKKIFVIAAIGICGLSCSPGVRIAAGPQTEEDRVVATFNELEIDGAMDVVITQDSSHIIRVEAPTNLMEFIKTEVSDSELKIWEASNHIVHTRNVKIYISQTLLDRIVVNGSGDVEAENIISSDFVLELNGSGDIELDIVTNDIEVDLRGSGDIDLIGSASNLTVELNGSGNVDARNLPTLVGNAEVDGSGNISLKVSTDLTADIEGSGNIYYWGNPTTLVTNVSGSGDVIDMD
jgi:hypothetical protein